jgi:vacuolar-type H+-ATPase subunit F/Vma7
VSTVVALGADDRMDGFALAGASVIATSTDDEIRAAWDRLASDVGLVILSADAARILEPVLDDRSDVLTAVLP